MASTNIDWGMGLLLYWILFVIFIPILANTPASDDIVTLEPGWVKGVNVDAAMYYANDSDVASTPTISTETIKSGGLTENVGVRYYGENQVFKDYFWLFHWIFIVIPALFTGMWLFHWVKIG